MTRSSLPTRHNGRSRWRSAAAGLGIVALSFTVAACGEEEPLDEPAIEEEVGELEEDD